MAVWVWSDPPDTDTPTQQNVHYRVTYTLVFLTTGGLTP